MTQTARRWTTLSAVALLTTTTSVAALAAPAQAKAKAAPVWTKLSTGAGINISTAPAVVRWGSKLLVTWEQDPGSINARLLGANAKVVGPISSVVSGWSEIDADAQPFILDGKPAVAFHGSHSLTTLDPYNSPVVYAQSPDAAAWSLGNGSLTQSLTGTGGYGIGALDDGTGQPVTVYAAGNTDHLAIHHGIDPAVPATVPDSATGLLGQTQDVNVARDASSGVMYAAYYSALSDATQGIHAVEVSPGISGPSAAAPGSVYTYQGSVTSDEPGQFVALASRVGGGVWAAYAAGYNNTSALVLWNVETGKTLVMHRPTADLQYVNLSAGPGGRLWVSWIQGGTVYATRTNPAVTKFGVVRTVVAPGDDVTRTAGNGALGPLDTAITSRSSGTVPAIYSARILEGLAVSAAPARVSFAKGGTVTVTVTDAGLPVPGVSVKVGSATKVTGSTGKVTFAIAAHSGKGSHAVTATATGWYPGASSFTVH